MINLRLDPGVGVGVNARNRNVSVSSAVADVCQLLRGPGPRVECLDSVSTTGTQIEDVARGTTKAVL